MTAAESASVRTDPGSSVSPLRLQGRRAPTWLELDARTGAPVALVHSPAAGSEQIRIPLSVAATLRTGGQETPGATGGLEYLATRLETDLSLAGSPRRTSLGLDDRWEVPTTIGPWRVTWSWTIRAEDAPALSLSLTLEPPPTGERVLRDLTIVTECGLQTPGSWAVQAPGNTLRPDVKLTDLPPRTGVSPAGGLRGSSALVAFQHQEPVQLVIWSFCRTEIGDITLSPTAAGASISYRTGLAGQPGAGERLQIEALHLDLSRRTWEQTRAGFADWFRTLAVTAPTARPTWVQGASLYEVQLGYSVFRGGHRYAPYPHLSDVLADLDRIQGLGFDALQLMPRQPYPSYNVHDYADIDTSYAPEQQLREFVEECHRRGMRVILDVLLHGVLDQESIRTAADGVRVGPAFAHLDEQTGDVFRTDPNDQDTARVAWSRHILDFEAHWLAGSPARSSLLEEHPDWFYRDSSGAPTGIYTKAFDASNIGFQDYFIHAVLSLVERLGVDGFRFDAPTYNDFANWSPATRHHASASPLACVGMFRRLRRAIKSRNPDLLMYTEPSGVLLRESMDLNYNYDEQWLVTALLAPDPSRKPWTVRAGADLARWLRDRDALLPPGSLTAHHLDSHDTFWWPLWGAKWRREQFGLDRVAALTQLFVLTGGPYMMFTGGEAGIEDVLREVLALKRRLPALSRGTSSFDVQTDDPCVFTVTRRHAGQLVVVLVNLADAATSVPILLPAAPSGQWTDALIASARLDAPGTDGRLSLDIPAWGMRVLSHNGEDVGAESPQRRPAGSSLGADHPGTR
jgi:glycosidase